MTTHRPAIPNTPLDADKLDWSFTSDTGLKVSSLGDDGETFLVFGHHDPEIALAAVRAYVAHDWYEGASFLDDVESGAFLLKLAHFTEHVGYCPHVTGECEDDLDDDEPWPCYCEEFAWCVAYDDAAQLLPGAVPIMVLDL